MVDGRALRRPTMTDGGPNNTEGISSQSTKGNRMIGPPTGSCEEREREREMERGGL